MNGSLSLVFSLVLLATSPAFAADCATDICSVPAGGNTKINKHSYCTSITSTRADDIMVPTKPATEYLSFVNNASVTGITKEICINFVSATNTVTGGVTNCAATKPPGLAVGDLIIAHIYDYDHGTPPTYTAPSGFTAISSVQGPVCNDYYVQMFYKIATAGDVAATNFTFTRGMLFNDCGLMVTAYRGTHQTSPIAGYARNTGLSGTTITYPSVTATANNSLSVAIGESCVSAPSTPSGGYTSDKVITNSYTRYSSKALTSTGATGSFTGSTPSGAWQGTHIIISPP